MNARARGGGGSKAVLRVGAREEGRFKGRCPGGMPVIGTAPEEEEEGRFKGRCPRGMPVIGTAQRDSRRARQQ